MKHINGLDVHFLANIVPMASDAEQAVLQEDIRQQGQRHNIILYRGKIVDGRCRALACEVLGIKVKSENLPNNMDLNAVADVVKSENSRRNLTNTQKAIVAYRVWEADQSIEQVAIYTAWAITKEQFRVAKYIAEHSPDDLDLLFQGFKVPYADDKPPSSSLQTVAKGIKTALDKRIKGLKAAQPWNPESALIREQSKKTFRQIQVECGDVDDISYLKSCMDKHLIQLLNTINP